MHRTIAVIFLMTASASAQVIVDEPKDVDAKLAEQIASDVADLFTDPVSTQIRRIRPSEEHEGSFCGEVNTKNQFGGYVGFKPFRYIVDRRKVYLANSGCE